MTIWISADSHWGHTNILRLCNRPFATIEEMDEILIANWNAVVSPSDTVYHLGDFCWKGQAGRYRSRLNGEIHLIEGNHDKNIGWGDFVSTSKLEIIKAGGVTFVLCHYPLEEWPGFYQGHVHLHGHVHGNLKRRIPRRLDVGVDSWCFRPLATEEIVEVLKQQGDL